MAYSVLIASLPDDEVMDFRERRITRLKINTLAHCSHAVLWVHSKPLREILGRALDGGETLRADLSHPARAPKWHPSASVIEIEQRLRSTWNQAVETSGQPVDPADWYVIEITKVLTIFRDAVTLRFGVVSFLEALSDSHRAQKAFIPVDAP
jgi:hypothetical protein